MKKKLCFLTILLVGFALSLTLLAACGSSEPASDPGSVAAEVTQNTTTEQDPAGQTDTSDSAVEIPPIVGVFEGISATGSFWSIEFLVDGTFALTAEADGGTTSQPGTWTEDGEEYQLVYVGIPNGDFSARLVGDDIEITTAASDTFILERIPAS